MYVNRIPEKNRAVLFFEGEEARRRYMRCLRTSIHCLHDELQVLRELVSQVPLERIEAAGDDFEAVTCGPWSVSPSLFVGFSASLQYDSTRAQSEGDDYCEAGPQVLLIEEEDWQHLAALL